MGPMTSTDAAQVHVLGDVWLSRDGREPVVIRTRSERIVAAILTVERDRAVDHEELADALWPAGPPSTWAASLRNTVSRVRAAFRQAGWDDDCIVTSDGRVRLRLPDDTAVDLEVARRAIADAGRPGAASARDARAPEGLVAALASLSRSFLAETDGEWVAAQRRRIHQLRVEGAEALADGWLHDGDPAAAVTAAQQVLELEPFRESAHRLLIGAQLAAGNRAEALRAYSRCRSLLAEELGVPPSAETEALYRRAVAADAESVPAVGTPGPSPARELRLAAGTDIPMIGRSEELHTLAAAVAGLRNGEVVVVALTGEAGIGKTRLAHELVARVLPTGVSVLWGRCDGEARVPFQPFADAATWRTDAAPPAWLTADAPDVGDGTFSDRIGELGAWIVDRATDERVVLVLDDVHWAGPETLAVLRRVVRGRPARGMALVLTFRDTADVEGDAVRTLLGEAARDAVVTTIDVPGLDDQHVAAILEHVGGGAADDEVRALARTLCRASGGNPFFAIEAVRHLAAGGALGRDGETGRWTIGTESVETLMLAGLRNVMQARLRSVSDPAVGVLRLGAVLGPDFDVAVVAAMASVGVGAVLDAVDEAIGHHLVEADAAAHRVHFTHLIVRLALLDALTAPRRAALHADAARALAASGTARPAELAHHWLEAGTLGDLEAAVAAVVAASEHARHVHAYDESEDVVQRALRLPISVSARATLQAELAETWSRRGRHRDAHFAFRGLLEDARRLGDAALFARAALGVAQGWAGTSEWAGTSDTRAVLDEALDRLPAEKTALRVRVLGQLSMITEEPKRRLALAREAIALVGSRSHVDEFAAAFTASRVALWSPADAEERLAFGLRAVDDAAADSFWRIDAELTVLGDLLQLGRRAEVDLRLAALRAVVERAASRRLAWRLSVADEMLAMVDGRLDDAERAATAGLSVWGDEPDADAQFGYAGQLLALRMQQGRAEEAVDVLRAVQHERPDLGLTACSAPAFLLDAGAADAGRRSYREIADDAFAAVPGNSLFDVTVAVLADAAWQTGDTTSIDVLVELAAPLTGQFVTLPGAGLFFGAGSHAVGLVAAVAGDDEAAIEHLAVAADDARSIGADRWACYSDIARAVVLRRRGDEDDAARLLQRTAAAPELVLPRAQRWLATAQLPGGVGAA
jgi:DNA-binding SARP family transcriptional activator/tetratricopeptide (TPR) repeat protein